MKKTSDGGPAFPGLTEEFNTWNMERIICPHCGEKNCEGVEWELFSESSDETGGAECGSCGKMFDVTREIVAYYTTRKVDKK